MEKRLLEIIAHLEQVKYAPPEDEITREHVYAALSEARKALVAWQELEERGQ